MHVNVELFRTEAKHFQKYGYYNKAVEETREWEEYWDEQKERCLNGYSVGGKKITGFHYWYLNFMPMLRVSKEALTGQSNVAVKNEGFPAFYDGDYDYFWVCDIARNGIDEQDYKDLELGVNIHPDDLTGGLHVAVMKARRKGYSYKNAAMLSRNFHLKRQSKNYAIADDKEFLLVDGILKPKCWTNLDFISDHTPWGQPKITDKDMMKYSGYSIKTDKGYINRGTRNIIAGVTLKNDPEKSRGKDGDILLWEEAGKFPELKKSWKIARETVGQGRFTTGLMIAFGTGGEEGADFESLEEMFYEPEGYGIIRIENQWDDGARGTYCGFFHPANRNFEGFMDEQGNSDLEGAKEYILKEREKAKKASDPSALSQYISEQPLNPMEATTRADVNLFPTAQLQEQLNKVRTEKKWQIGTSGYLYSDGDQVKFRISDKVKPINKFPHSPKDDLSGCVVIYQGPVKVDGKVPKNMYIICHDPYDHDSSTDKTSLGATYVIKRTNKVSPNMSECIVASYVGRPKTQDEYNRNLFLLAQYYNAKIGFENDRGDVIGYAKRFKMLKWLEEEFEMLHKKELQSRNVNRNYGMHMTSPRIDQGEIYIRDWLLTPVSTNPDGSKKLVLNNIYEPALLQELIKYNEKGNFDRVRALMVGQYHQKEMFNKKVVEQVETPHEDFFLNGKHFK